MDRTGSTGGAARRIARSVVVVLVAALAAPAAADLPSGPSGERPGPPILHAPRPEAPQLSNAAPFAAEPLLVSGTDAYVGGEYLYQDHLFDDRGADTHPGPSPRRDLQSFSMSPFAGDVQYPTDPKYAGNAADLVELRIRPTADAILYRVTLNSVDPRAEGFESDLAVVGIGIDADRSGGAPVEWPRSAGLRSPGLDHFITAWGTGGELTTFGGMTLPLPEGSVTLDRRTRQMTISVPRALLDPGQETWRLVAGTGLWDRTGQRWHQVVKELEARPNEPVSSSPTRGAPSVLNLAFRFDEPRASRTAAPYTTAPGVGNWFEDKQAVALASGTTAASTATGLLGNTPAGGDDFHADVDFSRLAHGAAVPLAGEDATDAGAPEWIHRPGEDQARIFPSSLNVPQGFRAIPPRELGFGEFPQFGGQLQPYLLHVPAGLDRSQPVGLTLALHALGASYAQYAVFSPGWYDEMGDGRNDVVATPLARGPDGWYRGPAEADVFEVWADVARQVDLDPARTTLTGYSMGGYGSYKLAAQYPDLFARAFTAVAPVGEGTTNGPADPYGTDGQPHPESLTTELLGNVRHVPFLNWVGSDDELVPPHQTLPQQREFDRLGLRSEMWVFDGADHFALMLLDKWEGAAAFLGDATVGPDPSRVDYRFFTAADAVDPGIGLDLVHDGAYWVSGLTARAGSDLAGVSARSHARGEGGPVTEATTPVGAGPPLPYNGFGTRWTGTPEVPRRNLLDLSFENLSRATIDGGRAGLDGRRPLRLELRTDGPAGLRLDLPLREDMRAVRVTAEGQVDAPEVVLDASGATITLGAEGTHTFLLTRPNDAPVAALAVDNPAPVKGQRIRFDASASTDPDGTIANYRWDLDGDGTLETDTGSDPRTDATFARAGRHQVTVEVRDDAEATARATVTVDVVNQLPVAAVTFSPAAPRTGQTVVLDGSGSDDPDGNVVRYRWDLNGDGAFETDTGATPRTTTTFSRPGTHTVRLRVSDDDGEAAVAVAEVVALNRAPQAALRPASARVRPSEPVVLDASEATDPDGSIARFEWDLDGDGVYERDTGQDPRLPAGFTKPGANPVTVQVTDDSGDTDRASTSVFVDAAPPSISITSPRDGSAHAVGAAVTARYACDDADKGIVRSCQGPVPTGTRLDTSRPGVREFTVTATDAVGNTARATVRYEVLGAPAQPADPPADPAPPAPPPLAAPPVTGSSGPPAVRGCRPRTALPAARGRVRRGSLIRTLSLREHNGRHRLVIVLRHPARLRIDDRSGLPIAAGRAEACRRYVVALPRGARGRYTVRVSVRGRIELRRLRP